MEGRRSVEVDAWDVFLNYVVQEFDEPVDDASQLDGAGGKADFDKSEEADNADGAGDEGFDAVVTGGPSIMVNVIQVSTKSKAGAVEEDEATGSADRRRPTAGKKEFELVDGREVEAEDGLPGPFDTEFDFQGDYSVVKIVGYAVAGIVLMV
ncbi:MAG: hypothetical protein GY812_02325, partial [Actinomycetia bacterium]|nr:hypothetical protein [Actinomycetes bacterium]